MRCKVFLYKAIRKEKIIFEEDNAGNMYITAADADRL